MSIPQSLAEHGVEQFGRHLAPDTVRPSTWCITAMDCCELFHEPFERHGDRIHIGGQRFMLGPAEPTQGNSGKVVIIVDQADGLY